MKAKYWQSYTYAASWDRAPYDGVLSPRVAWVEEKMGK